MGDISFDSAHFIRVNLAILITHKTIGQCRQLNLNYFSHILVLPIQYTLLEKLYEDSG